MLCFFKIGLCLFSSMSPPDPGLETSGRDVTEKWVHGVQKWPCVCVGGAVLPGGSWRTRGIDWNGGCLAATFTPEMLSHPDRAR